MIRKVFGNAYHFVTNLVRIIFKVKDIYSNNLQIWSFLLVTSWCWNQCKMQAFYCFFFLFNYCLDGLHKNVSAINDYSKITCTIRLQVFAEVTDDNFNWLQGRITYGKKTYTLHQCLYFPFLHKHCTLFGDQLSLGTSLWP